MANDKSKIEIEFEAVGAKDVQKTLDEIVNTTKTAHQKLYRYQAAYTKKAVDGFKQVDQAVSKINLKSLSKDLSNVALGTHEGAKFMKELEKSQLRAVAHSKTLADLNDGRKWGKAHEAAAEGIAKESAMQEKLIKQLKGQTDDIHKTESLLNALSAEYGKQHEFMQDIVDSGDDMNGAVQKRIALNEEELSNFVQQHRELGKIAKKEDRLTKSKQLQEKLQEKLTQKQAETAKAMEIAHPVFTKPREQETARHAQTAAEGFHAIVKTQVDKEKLEKARGVKEALGIDAPGLKGLGETFQSLGKLAGTGSKLAGVFESLSGVITAVETALGGWLVALGGFILMADKAAAERNRTLTRGLGSASLGGKDIDELGARVGVMGFQEGKLGGLRYTSEDAAKAMNTLVQSGMSLKNLGGDYDALAKVTKTAMVASRNFGLELEDGSKIVGDYFESYGAGVDKMQATFALMNRDIKNSSMTANNFLSIMQSVSSQFSIFLDQTQTFSKFISDLGKTGELSVKQIRKLADAFAGMGPKNIDESIRRLATHGGALKAQARDEFKRVTKEMSQTQPGQDPTRYAMLARQAAKLQTVMHGGTLNAATALQDALPPKRLMVGLFKSYGLNTKKELRSGQDNYNLLAQIASITGRSIDEVQSAMEATANVMENSGKKTIKELAEGDEDQINAIEEAEKASSEARSVAQKTTGMLEGSMDLANNLLASLVNGLNILVRYFTGDKQADIHSSAKEEAERLKKQKADEAATAQKQLQDVKKSVAGMGVTQENLKRAGLYDKEKYKFAPAATPAPTTKPTEALPPGPQPYKIDPTKDEFGRPKPKPEKEYGFTDLFPTKEEWGMLSDAIFGPTTPEPKPTPGGGVKTAGDKPTQGDAGAAGAGGPGVNITAFLKLANNKVIETIVEDVVFNREKRHRGS